MYNQSKKKHPINSKAAIKLAKYAKHQAHHASFYVAKMEKRLPHTSQRAALNCIAP